MGFGGALSAPPAGSVAELQPKSNLAHFSFKMTSDGNNFNDFPESVPTIEITTKIQRKLLFLSFVAVGLFLEWAQASCSINSTQINLDSNHSYISSGSEQHSALNK